MSFSKTDQVSAMARAGAVPKERAAAMLGALVEGITEALLAGDVVDVARLGRLSPRDRPPRKGRNVRTGAPLDIPASRTVRFSPAPALRGLLNPAATTEAIPADEGEPGKTEDRETATEPAEGAKKTKKAAAAEPGRRKLFQRSEPAAEPAGKEGTA